MSVARRLPWLERTWPLLQPLLARGVHAMLLHGARGIGKKNLAFDVADALLCAAPLPDGHGCGRCDECRLGAAGTHPDLRLVLPQALAEQLLPPAEQAEEEAVEPVSGDADGGGKAARASREIRVEQIRALADFLGIASHRAGRRVVLLAPADALNVFAANTLLKMLEEPPPATVFVLVSDALDEVLPTIRSRCVLVQVPLPEAASSLSWLAGQGVADPMAALAFAGGAPLAALEQTGLDALAPELADALYRMLEMGPALSAAHIVGAITRDTAVPACLRLLQRWAYDLVQYRGCGRVRYHPQREPRIGQLARQARSGSLWHWIDALRSASAAREHPLNARLVIESAMIGYLDVFNDRR